MRGNEHSKVIHNNSFFKEIQKMSDKYAQAKKKEIIEETFPMNREALSTTLEQDFESEILSLDKEFAKEKYLQMFYNQ